MTNRLATSSSPYLQQHKDNPVDWYPWGDEALELATREQKPIFLSVGYSSCHWCHVMAHESFEDPETAAFMNEHFVNIKVDREERPDIDSIYMTAVQALTGHGGWPMSVFLTPEQGPYYGGTYGPPQPRQGMPSFRQVLEAVADAWENKREDVQENAQNVKQFLEAAATRVPRATELSEDLYDEAVKAFSQSFDSTYGGFGNAPKFPQPSIIEFLQRFIRRRNDTRAIRMVELTLDQMAAGGINDQIGGGFHRYSVDAQWLVPHFEKMLYDNAQLAQVYLDAYRQFGHERYATVVQQTLRWVLREMTAPEGGFYSAQDADTEGEEGSSTSGPRRRSTRSSPRKTQPLPSSTGKSSPAETSRDARFSPIGFPTRRPRAVLVSSSMRLPRVSRPFAALCWQHATNAFDPAAMRRSSLPGTA
ncbi:MAG: thioredoxin domain-containing protein [Thermomicrobiales bacterium]